MNSALLGRYSTFAGRSWDIADFLGLIPSQEGTRGGQLPIMLTITPRKALALHLS